MTQVLVLLLGGEVEVVIEALVVLDTKVLDLEGEVEVEDELAVLETQLVWVCGLLVELVMVRTVEVLLTDGVRVVHEVEGVGPCLAEVERV